MPEQAVSTLSVLLSALMPLLARSGSIPSPGLPRHLLDGFWTLQLADAPSRAGFFISDHPPSSQDY